MTTPWIIIATIVGYFILLFLISWFATRKSDSKDALTGGNKAPWFIVAIAMIGAPISGVTFISVPGMVLAKGYSYLQMVLGFLVGYFAIAYVLIPLFYKRHLVSIYGYLEERFGSDTHKTGAWFFFISKMLGAAVRFYVVCITLQLLVFDALGIPFVLNVIVTTALIFLYTLQGGVKTVIWTDTLKSFCLIASVVLCIYFIAKGLGYDFGEMCKAVANDDSSRIFFFNNPKDGTYFWKQFIGGIFMAIAMTGLDQDMMQRTLASPNAKESQKGMIVSGITQIFVIGLFLILGTLLSMYAKSKGMAMPEKSDELFGSVIWSNGIPVIAGIFFIIGLIAAAYSAAGSALTSLTTSFTVDILGADKQQDETKLSATRKLVHVAMAVGMGIVIIVFYFLSNSDAISAVYSIASYTYGPILGLFAYGMMCKTGVKDKMVPIVCIAAPVLSWIIQWWLKNQFEYNMSFELLILNAALTMLGLFIFKKSTPKEK
ncbi:MAG: sodium:solute symporter [Muribaculaceae bacterium]|nr:sodium:solute symporter [Muribaculaceae bacterium]